MPKAPRGLSSAVKSLTSGVPTTEQRKRNARLPYDFEVECRAQSWGDPAFVYDEEKGLFRWTGGRFAFSREHADWALLRKMGRLKDI